MLKSLVDSVARRYQRNLGGTLKEYGLKYQDLLIEYDDVNTALERADPALVQARNRRLARASDVSLKQKPLPPHIQELQHPFDFYLTPLIEEAKKEREERAAINKNLLS
eukprot:TRINITY_DN23247_c0_g1_i1.p1 TRINITY_DN23247_c0_g1~~TRINITY_DN23247_c0_g1_i1.p1  ORF type:complete len:109 (+),score=33.88 TRINITY_DN23247_c0_g1_i1:771-1097(+)